MGIVARERKYTKCALIRCTNVCVSFSVKLKRKRFMADYRFSASTISRGKGQSSVASAAYRSASRLVDERTGEIHDYTRKSGVTHSEVLAPEGTPEWMKDRNELWNAVENVERRKDAQLSREIQISLPHELDQESRRRLVLDFVQKQFVNQGMIADVAIHAPSQAGDDRNHHAHVMLTMRELTGKGFGKKNRDWNSPEVLTNWREEWAQEQNRALERGGHDARVSHLSFEAQGIDREPTQHLGPVASDMERNGKASRIGDENREIANDNSERVLDHIERSKLDEQIAREQRKFEGWAEYKTGELENAQKLADHDLSQKHNRQNLHLEAALQERNGTTKKTVQAEVNDIDRRLQAKGVRKLLRTVFGRARSDKETHRELTATLAGIEKRENEERGALRKQQELELRKEARRQNKNKDRLKRGVETAKERREKDNWKPRSPSRGTKRVGRPERTKTAKPAPEVAKSTQKPSAATTEPEFKPSDRPTLADKKTTINSRVDDSGGKLSKSWRREQRSNDNAPSWRRQDKPTRTRKPPTPK